MGHLEATEVFLLEYSSTTSYVAYLQDKEGVSALHIASKEGHVDVMKKLFITIQIVGIDLVDNRG